MHFKRHLLIFFSTITICLLYTGCSSYRVLEKSQKEHPVWLASNSSGFIIGEGKNESLLQARTNAEYSAKNLIALNLHKKISNSNIGSTDSIIELLSRKINYTSFFININYESASNIYWEKVRDRSSSYYIYWLQFPFTSILQDSLISIWNLQRSNILSTLDTINQKIQQGYKNVPQIISDIKLCDSLKTHLFLSDSLSADKILQTDWGILNSSVTVSEQLSDDKLRFRLISNNIPLRYGIKPTFTGCAKVIKLFNDTSSNWLTATVNTSNCDICVDSNNIIATFDYGITKINSTMSFSLAKYCVDFGINKPIEIQYTKHKTGFLSSENILNIKLPLIINKPGKFTIQNIEYSYLHDGLFNNSNITKQFEGINLSSVNFINGIMTYSKKLSPAETIENNENNQCRITIDYINEYTKSKSSITFENVQIIVRKE